jgi:hypothetical protein
MERTVGKVFIPLISRVSLILIDRSTAELKQLDQCKSNNNNISNANFNYQIILPQGQLSLKERA